MTREEFLHQLNICDDTIILNEFSSYADRLSAHDQAQREEIARLREALEEANKQLISAAAGTDEFGGLLRRIRIALAKEADRG